jgi:hypothetical protein
VDRKVPMFCILAGHVWVMFCVSMVGTGLDGFDGEVSCPDRALMQEL